ncbi:molybdate ABC transporter substrate-binding protein [Novipirellula rosea]|uniref:Molybdate ABC transporter substrate-binding protein n=1 Tax=Novipirellula rosea TaxID=1031540 RepID=A0ABP8MPD7_9BACT
MNRISLLAGGSVIVFVICVALLFATDTNRSSDRDVDTRPLMLYCAASNRGVMEQIVRDYQREFQRQIHVQYGPSQTLLSSIAVSKTGDLFLPADDSYLKIAEQKQLVTQQFPIAMMHAVVAVKKDNPHAISKLEDLLQDDIRFVQASPDSAAIGKVTQTALKRLGRWDAIDAATIGYRTSVNEVANDIEAGSADAGIVYDAVLHTYPNLTLVRIAELQNATSQVSIGIIATTNHLEAAEHFARYVSRSARSREHYKNYGFDVSD